MGSTSFDPDDFAAYLAARSPAPAANQQEAPAPSSDEPTVPQLLARILLVTLEGIMQGNLVIGELLAQSLQRPRTGAEPEARPAPQAQQVEPVAAALQGLFSYYSRPRSWAQECEAVGPLGVCRPNDPQATALSLYGALRLPAFAPAANALAALVGNVQMWNDGLANGTRNDVLQLIQAAATAHANGGAPMPTDARIPAPTGQISPTDFGGNGVPEAVPDPLPFNPSHRMMGPAGIQPNA